MHRPVWDLLRGARGQLGISQAEMSGRLGITQSALSRWERSGRGLNEEIVAKIERLISDRAGGREADSLESHSRLGESADNGRACARIRKRLRRKQQEVADLAGISRTALSMFENGYFVLSSGDLERLFLVLESQVAERGYEAGKDFSSNKPLDSEHNVDVSLRGLDAIFAPAKHDGLRELESRLETFGDPTFRLKIAEEQMERDQETIRHLTEKCTSEKQTLAKVEAENVDHKRHKELLGDFAAAQQSLIAYQHEKILALEGNRDRDFGKGVRMAGEIDVDIVEARRRMDECHDAITSELRRKAAGN